MTLQERYASKYADALNRAENPRNLINIQTVFEAASAKGIADAMPGENVLTFNAWKAKGRVVKKGEKALAMLPVFYSRDVRDPSSGDVQTQKHAGRAAVFHISQTKAMGN
jgi:hypothetical protein